MKVLWVSHFVPWPPAGGNLQRSFHLIRILSREARIDLVTFHRRASLADRDIEGARAALMENCRSVEIFPIENESSRPAFAAGLARNLVERDPYTVAELRSSPFREALESRLERGEYDAVHFDTIDLAPYRLLTGRIPSVMNHHNVESLLFRRRAPYEKNPLTRFYLALQGRKLEAFEKEWYRRFDANLFVSESDRREAEKAVDRLNGVVIPNGVDTGYYTPGEEGTGERVVWVGGLGWFPNRDAVAYLLDRIWPRIVKRRPGAVLDLIGSAPEKLVPAGAGEAGVKVHGFVDDIRPMVAAAKVFVVPIRVGGGTRLKILDAMAMGKAVVTTRIGCEGIDPEEGEEMLLADTAEEFADRVCELLEGRERREAIGRRARRLAERKFAWEVVGGKLLDLYRGFAGGGGAGRNGGREGNV